MSGGGKSQNQHSYQRMLAKQAARRKQHQDKYADRKGSRPRDEGDSK